MVEGLAHTDFLGGVSMTQQGSVMSKPGKEPAPCSGEGYSSSTVTESAGPAWPWVSGSAVEVTSAQGTLEESGTGNVRQSRKQHGRKDPLF